MPKNEPADHVYVVFSEGGFDIYGTPERALEQLAKHGPLPDGNLAASLRIGSFVYVQGKPKTYAQRWKVK